MRFTGYPMIDLDYVKQTAHALTQRPEPSAEAIPQADDTPQPVLLRLCDMNTDPPEPSDECLRDWAGRSITEDVLAKLLCAAVTGVAFRIHEEFKNPEDNRTVTLYGVRLEFPDGRTVERRFPVVRTLAPGYGLVVDWEIVTRPLFPG